MHTDNHLPKQHQQHHGNGFTLGLLIGAGVATVLSTKRGRAMLKDVATMALSHLDNFLEEEAVGTLQEEEITPEPTPAPPPKQIAQNVEVEDVDEMIIETPSQEPVKEESAPRPKKKFFRGLKKNKA